MLKRKTRKILVLGLTLLTANLVLNIFSLSALAQSKIQGQSQPQSQSQGKNKATNKTSSSAPAKLIYSLEIDDIRNKDGEIITLAIDAVTIIHCPEAPMQVILGNETAVAMKETLPTQTDIYISAIAQTAYYVNLNEVDIQ